MATKKSTKKTATKPIGKIDASEKEEVASQEPKIPTWQIIIAVAILGIILAGIIMFSQTEDSYEYNGFVFVEEPCPDQDNQCWTTQVQLNIGLRQVTVFNGPREVEDILVDERAIQFVRSLSRNDTEIILAINEDDPGRVGVVATNIARVTGEKLFGIPTRGAVFGSEVVCEMATQNRAIIHITEGPEGVYVQNGCIVISAEDPERLVVVGDAFVLHLLSVMQ